jgi:RHS repeat-associated protein
VVPCPSPQGNLLALKKGTKEYFTALNRHGDLTYLFKTTGALNDTRTFDPFGGVINTTGTTLPTVGFQGDYTDPTSSKVWMGARWYDPATDHFLSRDSVSGQLQTPISLNRYTYAQGDPLSYMDPDGHWPKADVNAVRGEANGIVM